MVIIGCGTGRCGSQSLANLFSIQENIAAYHELYLQGPRYFGTTKSIRYLCNMNQSGYSKDEFISQFYNIVKDNKNNELKKLETPPAGVTKLTKKNQSILVIILYYTKV